MSPPPSKPDLLIRAESLSELYPTGKDTLEGVRDRLVKHARKHEQHVSTFVAHNTRISEVEQEKLPRLDEKVEALERRDNEFKEQLTLLGAEIKQEIAVAKAQVKALLGTITVVWSIVVVVIGVLLKVFLK